jgi:hypothetical protein
MNLTGVTVSADIARAASKSLNTKANEVSAAEKVIQTESTNLLKQQPINAVQTPGAVSVETQDTAKNDSVRVSSSIGRAASSGQLSRQEALAIYQQIASLL